MSDHLSSITFSPFFTTCTSSESLGKFNQTLYNILMGRRFLIVKTKGETFFQQVDIHKTENMECVLKNLFKKHCTRHFKI